MNNEFVTAEAGAWARRAVAARPDPRERIDWMYRSAFARPAAGRELDEILTFLGGRRNDPDAWADVAHVLFNSAEFIYVP